MKTRMLLILIFLATNNANAETEKDELCANMSALAETIMKNRQQGVAMADAMKILNSPSKEMQSIKEVARLLVVDAYSKNRWQTPEMVKREIEDFRDSAYLACLKGWQK